MRITILSALLVIMASSCGSAAAAELDSGGPTLLHINTGFEQEYNDNIFFTRRDQEEDFITTGTFGVDAGYVTERVEFHVNPKLRYYKYRDNSNLDDHDQIYNVSLDYQVTPRVSFSSQGAYINDNRRDDQVAETGVVFENVERNRWEALLSGEVLISENAALSVFGSYWNDDYEDREQRSSFSDLEVIGGGLNYTRLMSVFYRPSHLRLNAGYFNYNYDTAETDYYYLTVGTSIEVNETYSVIVEGGPRYTDSEFDVAREQTLPFPPFSQVEIDEETSSNWGGNGLVSLAYQGEKTDWEIALSREVTASSGDTQTVEQTELKLDWNHRVTWELSTHLQMRYFYKESNRDNSDIGDIDEDTLVFQPRVRYRITNDWFLEGTYRYTWRDDNEINQNWDRNQVLFQIGHQWKILE